jgi:peroxiredoxin
MSETGIAVGSKAPAFTLKDQDEKDVSLSDMAGRKVVVAFHPLAWTGVCAQQMQGLESNREEYARRGAVAVGLSVDSVPSKTAWAKEIGVVHTRLLADFWPHGGVAAGFGVFRERNGFSERAVFVLDAKGVVKWKKVYPIRELPDVAEILAAVDAA